MIIRRSRTALTAVVLILMSALAIAQAPPAPVSDTPPDTPAAAVSPVEQQPLLVGIQLNQRPVGSLKAAGVYAAEWIRAGGLNELVVGRVRRDGGLFIVDLVTMDGQRTLQNQLLVRSRDGLGTLVYPASINGPVPPEVMAGMAGLEGMSGMSGTRDLKVAMQRKLAIGDSKKISVRNGRRAVDAWLLHNGLLTFYAGNTRDLGGIFVSDIVDVGGARKNQAVLRKADGFVQMINPVGSLSKMADASQRGGH